MKSSVIIRDPGILGGAPVFEGTRVPVRSLLDCLEGGYTIGQFMDDFPTVRREQVIAFLEETKAGLEVSASA